MLNDKLKRLVKKAIKRSNATKYDFLARKVKLLEEINSYSHNGEIAVEIQLYWMVDHVTDTRIITVPASLMELHLALMSYDDYDSEAYLKHWAIVDYDNVGTKPHQRDHIAEAHEDGHPHVVYC